MTEYGSHGRPSEGRVFFLIMHNITRFQGRTVDVPLFRQNQHDLYNFRIKLGAIGWVVSYYSCGSNSATM